MCSCGHFELRFFALSPATQPFRLCVSRLCADRGLPERRRCVSGLLYGGAVSHGLGRVLPPPGWTLPRSPPLARATGPYGTPLAAEAAALWASSAGAGSGPQYLLRGWARLRLCRPRILPALTPLSSVLLPGEAAKERRWRREHPGPGSGLSLGWPPGSGCPSFGDRALALRSSRRLPLDKIPGTPPCPSLGPGTGPNCFPSSLLCSLACSRSCLFGVSFSGA